MEQVVGKDFMSYVYNSDVKKREFIRERFKHQSCHQKVNIAKGVVKDVEDDMLINGLSKSKMKQPCCFVTTMTR